MPAPETTRYNIGAVSRLTGISREKIRIWERRYGAVEPERDQTNLRKYSQHDVERLVLIRRLVDSGQTISNVANLTLAALQARTENLTRTQDTPQGLPQTALAVRGEDGALRGALADLGIPEVADATDLAEAQRWLGENQAELIAAEFPTLLPGDLTGIRRLRKQAPQSHLLVIYRFGSTPVLAQLQAMGIHTVKAPLQPDDLQPQQAASHMRESEPVQPDYRRRQFSPQQLVELSNLAHRLQCECPRHLADLVRDLTAFEDYSLSCEAESRTDAAMHREVYDMVARARALVEDALGLVAAEEDLEI